MTEESGNTAATRRGMLGIAGAVAGGLAISQMAAGNASAATGSGGSIATRTISLAQAQRLTEAAVRYVRDKKLPPMYVLVVDSAGEAKASLRMDNNSSAAAELVPHKAHTARTYRTATADLATNIKDPGQIASFVASGASLLPGGRPIFENGQFIGALAVGGGTPAQDDEVARAALSAL
ncbi:GlcG/HbpS family heme-binding protein [Streptomyces sp. WI04-05B]|uniref:GlcG/HbpS family heme-binding protein n=1 Tax=Streptomyces TaxID=1883 RepID=UPI0029A4C423|nr:MULTISPECIES: heme-binding protein [unclassified Streptomyces]MDX2549126.1 heme-binding protein [Streptomyces sp. WI04-05B]MDX2590646.1 heme-binding protein [Streptomyces sp. WI04-05A]MDX3745714.1 heme-binding protein [Streptomyces sp. AK08-02]